MVEATDNEWAEYKAAKKDYLQRYEGETIDDMALTLYFSRKYLHLELQHQRRMTWIAVIAAAVMAITILVKP